MSILKAKKGEDNRDIWYIAIPPDSPNPYFPLSHDRLDVPAHVCYQRVRLAGKETTFSVFLERGIPNNDMIEMLINGYKGGNK